HSQARCSTIGTTHAPLARSKRPYDFIALLSCIFVSNAVFFTPRICSLSSDRFGFMQVSRRGLLYFRCSDFCERRLKRFARSQEHRSLNEILEFTNIAGPVPGCQSFHYSHGDRLDALLHFLGELLDEIVDEQRNVFPPISQRRNTDRKDI